LKVEKLRLGATGPRSLSFDASPTLRGFIQFLLFSVQKIFCLQKVPFMFFTNLFLKYMGNLDSNCCKYATHQSLLNGKNFSNSYLLSLNIYIVFKEFTLFLLLKS
jgi:hypothetical protein